MKCNLKKKNKQVIFSEVPTYLHKNIRGSGMVSEDLKWMLNVRTRLRWLFFMILIFERQTMKISCNLILEIAVHNL